MGSVAAIAATLALCACSADVPPLVWTAPADTALRADSTAPRITVDTVARDLVVPWGIAVAPDGRIFVTERRGRILVIPAAGGVAKEWATLEVHAEDPEWGPESGLTGIALAPDFATSGTLFVAATTWRSAGDRDRSLLRRAQRRLGGFFSRAAGLVHKTRIIRYTERDGRGTDPIVVLDDVPAHHYHTGGALAFGPDGHLYAGFGDALTPEFPREPNVLAGKIVRLTPDRMATPQSRPTTPRILASGLRNPQAFVWLGDGTMLSTDHGPTGLTHEGGQTGRDELNVIRVGNDYGWPQASGWESAQGLATPLWVWRDPIAPAGMTVYQGSFQPWRGSVIVAALYGRLERIALERRADEWVAAAREPLLVQQFGRIRSVYSDPDGRLLITTSNRDARGRARPGDDLLVRLTVSR